MKYKQIILFFVIALPISISLRLVQLFQTIEPVTGFFKHEYEGVGSFITIIILAIAAVLALFAFFSVRVPLKIPKVALGMGLASGLLASAISIELFFGYSTFGTVVWQKLLLYVFGIASVIWFSVYALKDFIGIPIPRITALIPCVYFILKIICNFAGISSLALISDNVLLIATYCVILLFMISFAKAYNNVTVKCGYKKLLATGLASSVLCFTQSVPNVIYHFAQDQGYSHTAMVTNLSVFFTGIFIISFLVVCFSNKNTRNLTD